MPTGQVFATSTSGGYTALPWLSEDWRKQAQNLMKIRQFARKKQAFGKRKGLSVEFDKFSRIGTAGGTLTETSTIPQNDFTISQGTCTLKEWGNSIPYTELVETVGQISIKDRSVSELRDDAARVLDKNLYNNLATCAYKYVGSGPASGVLTTNGTATATSTSNYNRYHCKKMVGYLKRLNAPAASGGYYFGILSVTAGEGIFDDLESVKMYTSFEDMALGEIGKYKNVRHVEETNSLKDSFTNYTSGGEAFIFGDDAVMEAVAAYEEIRYQEFDFGRDKRVAWYGVLGHKLIWDVGDTQQTVVHFTSA